MFEDDNDTPPTSTKEALARSRRPPPEKYDPDKPPRWSITETLAWIIWRDLDAVRIERDDYRSECADWHPERLGSELLAEKIADKERTGDARRCPDSHKKLLKRLEELIEAEKGKQRAWHRRHWPPSSWNRLCLRAISEAGLEPRQQAILSPQDAKVELWQAAEEGGIIKATALEYESVKAYADDLNAGNPIEIPAIHWKYLKFDPSRRPILLGPGGRVYGDVQFRRLGVKEQWPPLSVEPIELAAEVVPSESEKPEPERVEAPELGSQPEPEAGTEPDPEPAKQTEPEPKPELVTQAESESPKPPKKKGAQWKRAEFYIEKNFPNGTDGITTKAVHDKISVDEELKAEGKRLGRAVPSPTLIDRVLGRRVVD